jgi:molecular chaperone DnaK (HSP70)
MAKKSRSEKDSRFIIGIDLGTTQCALSYVDLDDKNLKVKTFAIPQLVGDGQVEELPTLASVLFLKEDSREISCPEWMHTEATPVLGSYARELGSQIPSRFVHSSKSWLCHPRIDRTAPILPWQSDTVKEKLSPVQSATEYLKFMIKAWDSVMIPQNEAFAFSRQKVIVTVPASFDPAARNLTLEAIEMASIKDVSLLEEPQAAFYDYLNRNPKRMVRDLKGVETVLVVDIGGGTTDFSLIKIEWPEDSADPKFSRLAVGPHLLIGGDNLDLALARKVDAAFKHRGKKLVAKQWQAILHQSMVAKENVLSNDDPGKVTFTVAGAGSRVLAGAAKVNIEKKEIRDMLIDGFFPLVEADDRPEEDNTLGLSEAGLPFTRDAAISKHMAAFLKDNEIIPDAILFNGGTLQAECLTDRLFEVLSIWKGTEPKVLSNPHPTLAVAAGAAYYGMVSMGLGKRIQSGNPVSIYLGVGTGKSSTADRHVPEQLICLLPKGSESENEYGLEDKAFGIDLSRDSAFYLYYTPTPPKAELLGRTIRFNSKRYLPLPPYKLKAQTGKGVKQVELKVVLKETGYLQVFCEELDGKFSQELRFDLSCSEKATSEKSAGGTKKRRVPITKAQLKKVEQLIDSAFDQEIEFNKIFKELEAILGIARGMWDAEMLRQLFDIFIDEGRFGDSESSMKIWFRLLGYTLRPGYGVQGDLERVDKIWDLLDEPYEYKNPEFWSDWWVMWKRIAPGLSIERQEAVKDKIEPSLFPPKKKAKGLRTISQHERNQLWRLLGNLERISVSEKERLGWWIAKAPMSYGKDALALHALGRLGARDLSYAPETNLIPQAIANDWANHLIRKAFPGNSYLDWALRELGRKTGDRLVQIDDVLRKNIVDIFKKKHRKKAFIKPLLKAARLADKDLAEFIGESLPSGFVWVKDME